MKWIFKIPERNFISYPAYTLKDKINLNPLGTDHNMNLPVMKKQKI